MPQIKLVIESLSVAEAARQPEMTALLKAWGGGDRAALDRLTPLVMRELKRIARRHLRAEHGGRSLQTAALVNEAWLRLVDVDNVAWEDRAHFFGISARIMRHILVEAARARLALRRGGDALCVTFAEDLPAAKAESEFVAIDEALTALAAFDERKARMIELRFFGGLSVAETELVLGVSEQSVHRDWRLARAWLARELGCRS
jgi:RNA polymerase sigma factor (TIGR02999 family)